MNAPPRAWAALVVGLAAAAVVIPALGNGFAYDDLAIIAGDPRVHTFDIGAILSRGYWADAEQSLYRPITSLSFALDWSLAGDNPAWFHLTNLLAHAAASVLAFALLARFFSVAGALAGGLVFAVHPVHVEAFANVVGRAELLAACFVLATLLVWAPREPDRARRAARWLAAGAFTLLAIGSKESAIVLPALILLVDFAAGETRADGVRAYARRAWSGYTVVVVAILGYLAVRTVVLGGFTPSAVDPVFEVAQQPGPRWLTALQAWPHYLRLLLFPHVLLADYGPRITLPVSTFTPTVVFGAVLLVTAVAGGIIAALTGRSRAALALLWFPITVLPVSNLLFPIGVFVAERTLYLPSIALAMGVAGLTVALPQARPALRSAAVGAFVLALVLLAGRALLRAPEWSSTDRIIAALLRDRPDAFRGEWYAARLARLRGDTVAALAGYDRALRLWPLRSRLVVEAAGYAAETGRAAWARSLAGHAADQWPERLDAQRLLAGTALDVGDTAVARRALHAGLRIDPDDDVLLRMRAALGPDPTEGK